jgi:hypothetical protein
MTVIYNAINPGRCSRILVQSPKPSEKTRYTDMTPGIISVLALDDASGLDLPL